jgi:hypothetical protein
MKQGPQAESGGGPLAECWAWLAAAVHGPLPHWAKPATLVGRDHVGLQRWAEHSRYVGTTATLRRHHGDAGPQPGGARRRTLAWRRSSTMDRARGTSVPSSPTTCKQWTGVDGVASAQPGVATQSSSTTGEREEVVWHRCSACSDSATTYMEATGA